MRNTGLLAAAVMIAGCGQFPRDPEGTSRRVGGGTLRVGVAHAPPWAIAEPSRLPEGIEVEIVQELADDLGARVEWRVGGEGELLSSLKRYELDIVIGGLTDDSPWRKRVAFTKPHRTVARDGKTTRYVIAAPPGENAWVALLNRFVSQPARPARSRAAEPQR